MKVKTSYGEFTLKGYKYYDRGGLQFIKPSKSNCFLVITTCKQGIRMKDVTNWSELKSLTSQPVLSTKK